jgi:hypothetical protein
MASVQAQMIAKLLAKSARGAVRIPGAATRGSSGKGRSTLARRSTKTASRPSAIPNACQECGLILENSDRLYCDECLPRFKSQRTEKLVGAARAALTKMRASPNDPAKAPQAVAKRVAAHAERLKAARAWELQHPGPHDVEAFKREIAPSLIDVTLPKMMRVTGLSSGYCWRIRRGERVPHPMHWEPLRALCCNTELQALPDA